MKKLYLTELKGALVRARTVLAILLTACCILVDSIDLAPRLFEKNSPMDAHYFWFHSITYAGIYGKYFIAVLAAAVFAGDFCRQYRQGIWRYVIARMGVYSYTLEKYVCCFLSGGLTAAGGGLLYLVTAGSYVPLFNRARYIEIEFLPYAHILDEYPVMYFGIGLYLLFLSGGFWACAGYTLSVYLPLNYSVYAAPFLFMFVLTRMYNIFGISDDWRLDYWLCGRSAPLKNEESLLVITIAVLGLCCIFGKIFSWKLSRRLEYE